MKTASQLKQEYFRLRRKAEQDIRDLNVGRPVQDGLVKVAMKQLRRALGKSGLWDAAGQKGKA